MPLILNIDTATECGGIGLSENGKITHCIENNFQKEHASFIQPAILEIVKKANIQLSDLNGIAVTIGPGSYTGLRVGLASAKGICYTLKKPLISVSTLQAIAQAYITQPIIPLNLNTLICPCIDARRMEIYTALYSTDCFELKPPYAAVIDNNFFNYELKNNQIIFCGNGASKVKVIISHPNAIFPDIKYSIKHMAALAWQKFVNNDFSDLAYSEPLYVKNVYTSIKEK